MKLDIEEALRTPFIMDRVVGYSRSTPNQLDRLFEYRDEFDLKEMSMGSPYPEMYEMMEPTYSYIAKGEYGNCLLVLYRSVLADVTPDPDEPYYEEYMQTLEDERYFVIGVYVYKYKGYTEREVFKGYLKKEIEIEG